MLVLYFIFISHYMNGSKRACDDLTEILQGHRTVIILPVFIDNAALGWFFLAGSSVQRETVSSCV